MQKKGILQRLKEGPVLGDGGYLLELEKRGWVRPGPFTPEVAIVYPDALRELHIEFRQAGAEVLQAESRELTQAHRAGGTAADIDDEPHVRQLQVARRTLAVASAQNAAAEHLLVKPQRSFNIGDDHKVRDGHPILRRHLIAFLLYLNLTHG